MGVGVGVVVAVAIGVGVFVFVGVKVGVGVSSRYSTNVAVISVVWLILIEHKPVPLQPPVQPTNVPVLIAVAERIIVEFGK